METAGNDIFGITLVLKVCNASKSFIHRYVSVGLTYDLRVSVAYHLRGHVFFLKYVEYLKFVSVTYPGL